MNVLPIHILAQCKITISTSCNGFKSVDMYVSASEICSNCDNQEVIINLNEKCCNTTAWWYLVFSIKSDCEGLLGFGFGQFSPWLSNYSKTATVTTERRHESSLIGGRVNKLVELFFNSKSPIRTYSHWRLSFYPGPRLASTFTLNLPPNFKMFMISNKTVVE